VFFALALAVSLGGGLPGERGLYDLITGAASPPVVAIFSWINYLGDRRVLVPAIVVLLLILPRRLRSRWWLWGATLAAAGALEWLAKGIVARPRPAGSALGFPSGHAAAAAAFFVLAAYLGGKSLRTRRGKPVIWTGAALIILIVGIARMVLRAHWPVDALGGAALGMACAAAAAWWNEANPAAMPKSPPSMAGACDSHE
jgi:undecaprenyl-diphosphatase